MKFLRLSITLPICLFIILSGFLWRGLSLHPKELPSALIGHPAPKFTIPTVEDPTQRVNETVFTGKISILNIWATWCVSCRKEHAVWMEIRKNSSSLAVRLIGLNYHDTLKDSQAYLKANGNPYEFNFFDEKGMLGIEFGVYGTPETYIIDQNGIIRYRHVGPINHDIWQNKILPFIESLKAK